MENINRVELLKALEAVKPGLSNKEFIEQATSFAFTKGRVVTYNDEISVSYPIAGLDIEGAIKADELYALLNKIKVRQKDEPDTVTLTVNGNEVLLTAGKHLKAGFTLQSEVKLPLNEVISHIGDWVDLPTDFIQGLSFVKGSVAKHAFNRPMLTGIHINSAGFVEASDSYRLTVYNFDNELGINTFGLPSSSVPDVIQFNPTEVAEGRGWIHFKTAAGAIMSCRIFQDDYPDTAALRAVEGTVITFPEIMDEVIERAAVFAARDSEFAETVHISVTGSKIVVQSKMETGGEFEESIRFKYDTPFEFYASPFVIRGVFAKQRTFTLSKNRMKSEASNWMYVGALREK